MVGAPKCGTTAMYQYLRQHPDIFMHPGKEPNFFANELFDKDHTLEQYLHNFKNSDREKILGEASTWYLYSKEAAKRIKLFEPKAKILIMLRNPVDMIYALHNQLVYGGQENIKCFKAALEAESERRFGKLMPNNYRDLSYLKPERLLYRSIGMYGDQVLRYLSTFDKSQVHVVIFDDFYQNPETTYIGILEFLGINTSFRPSDFAVVNASKSRRYQGKAIQQLRTNPMLLELTRTLIPYSIRKKIYKSLSSFYGKLNTTSRQRPPLANDLKKSLTTYFIKDINRLEELIERDLSIWKN